MKITLEHYSCKKRKVIDPKFMGSANAGEERNRIRKIPRSYWYKKGSQPEHRFKGYIKHVWTGRLKLYDITRDSLFLCNNPPGFWEERLKNWGYDGYYNSTFYPEIVVIFRTLIV